MKIDTSKLTDTDKDKLINHLLNQCKAHKATARAYGNMIFKAVFTDYNIMVDVHTGQHSIYGDRDKVLNKMASNLIELQTSYYNYNQQKKEGKHE